MKCPKCNTEMRIKDNKLVRRADESFAYRMRFECRSKNCPDYGNIVKTVYTPVTIEDDPE